MAQHLFRISLLPDHIRAKLSSSCKITTPEDIIEGLFTNALDADARSVVLEADFARGCITCCDDGTGICGVEFSEQGNLVKPHCTSRFEALHPTYGRHGIFLSNLSSLCLLSVTSQHRGDPFANKLVFHRGAAVNRQEGKCKEEVELVRPGTRVTVQNLFGDVPVRFKQMSLRYTSSTETERAFDRVKEILIGYLIAYPRSLELHFLLKGEKQRSLHVRSPGSGVSHFALDSTVSLLFQAKFLSTADRRQWRSASVRTAHFSIRALISTAPSPSRAAQFISIGLHPIRRGHGTALLFDAIDRLFEASSFGIVDVDLDVSSSGRMQSNEVVTKTGKVGKGVDKWPAFYIRIDTKSEEMPSMLGQSELSAGELLVIDHLTKAIEALVLRFLIFSGFARGTQRGESKRVHNCFSRNKGSIERQHTQSHEAEISQAAAETRFLSHWHRVKSARPSFEDFHYGLGFKKPTEALASVEDPVDEESRLSECCSGESSREQTESDVGTDDTGAKDDVAGTAGLTWTNPRNGQVIRINPRTGAVMPAVQQDSVRPDRCCAPQNESDQYSGSLQLPYSSGFIKTRTRNTTTYLQKYLGMTSSRHIEARIASMYTEEPAFSNGRQEAIGRGTTAAAVAQAVTRHALSTANFIRQVDQKFVLTMVSIPREYSEGGEQRRLIVLIDQHAADERIKFEKLCQDFCKGSPTILSRPIVFEVDEIEARLLEERHQYFRDWCIYFNLTDDPQHTKGSHKRQTHTVEVTTLPNLVAERCRADPKLLIDLLRRELWSGRARFPCSLSSTTDQKTRSWWSQIAQCPEGMMEMLKSRSCRTAVMFNDALNILQCRELVQKLAQCRFPFQCAHGRPALTVLADLDGTDSLACTKDADTGTGDLAFGYGEAWTNWIEKT